MKEKNLIRYGLKEKDVDEQTIEISCLDKNQEASFFVPYGMFIRPEDGNLCLIFQQEGNEDSLITIVTDLTNRDTDLEEGELFLGIPTETARIKFRNTDKIVFQAGGKEGGDFLARFNELKDGFDELKQDYNNFVSSYNSHTHNFNYNAGPTPSSGTTQNTTTTENPTTASIDNAKIDNIEVPEL